MRLTIYSECVIQEEFFCFFKASFYCFSWVARKVLIIDDIVMKVVSEEISTQASSMAIENSKERTFRPFNFRIHLFALWFHYVKNNGDPIFIISPVNALISACGIGSHYTIPLVRAFWLLMVRQRTLHR